MVTLWMIEPKLDRCCREHEMTAKCCPNPQIWSERVMSCRGYAAFDGHFRINVSSFNVVWKSNASQTNLSVSKWDFRSKPIRSCFRQALAMDSLRFQRPLINSHLLCSYCVFRLRGKNAMITFSNRQVFQVGDNKDSAIFFPSPSSAI